MRAGAPGALRERTPGRALDVGCGNGTLGSVLISQGWEVDGIEPSEGACEEARGRGVRAQQGTLETVEPEPGRYDAVVFHQSLEHIGDPVTALAKAHAALAPGGIVAISVPNFDSWARRRFGREWFHLDLPRHRVHFGERSLRLALERAGFEPVQALDLDQLHRAGGERPVPLERRAGRQRGIAPREPRVRRRRGVGPGGPGRAGARRRAGLPSRRRQALKARRR